jgi:hypothetical protein
MPTGVSSVFTVLHPQLFRRMFYRDPFGLADILIPYPVCCWVNSLWIETGRARDWGAVFLRMHFVAALSAPI